MAVINQLNINLGTEANQNFVLHDINDKRITTTAITTCSHILASSNASLTSIAPITAANLASVLGGSKTNQTLSTSDNLNSCTSLNVVYTWGNSLPTNAPTDYGVMIVENLRGIIVQKCTRQSYASYGLYYRQKEGNNWSDWRQIYDTSLLTNSSLLSSLASALGVPSASFKATGDEDGSTIDTIGAGIYQFFSATYFSNAPRTGIVFCFIRGSYKFQVVLGFSGIDSHLILKSRYYNGSSWGIWGTLDFT